MIKIDPIYSLTQ